MLFTEFDMDTAIKIWKEEGKDEGKKEKQMEIAKNLIQKGLDNDFIVETTGLSLEEVEAMRAEI